MKARLFFVLCTLVILPSCVAPPAGTMAYRTPSRVKRGSYELPKPGQSSVSQPGETSSAYRLRQARQQRDALPEAQMMYHSSEQDPWGHRTESGLYRSTGGVTEEVHIGSQQIPVVPGQRLGPAPAYNNVYQGGYVPPGTSGIYDPRTGRVLPVRR